MCEHLPTGVSYSLFADDCAIWAQGHDLTAVHDKLQRALDVIEEWAHKWGMVFSGAKSSAVIFSRYRGIPDDIRELRIQGTNIPYVPSARFLGITFDRKMNMQQHVTVVRTKVTKRLS